METNRKVGTWRTEVKDALIQRSMDGDNPNKYSGYVYDAVWLYAHSLDRLIKQNQSYIQDIHSSRSINKYVDIISSMDFNGVSGRINFPNNGHSRLSHIKVGGHSRILLMLFAHSYSYQNIMYIILLLSVIILIIFEVLSHLMGYCNKHCHIMLHNLKGKRA